MNSTHNFLNDKKNVYYHVHVNVFNISQESRDSLVSSGFFCDPFVPLETSYAPPEHYSCETSDKTLMKTAWTKGLEILKKDHVFVGYIEQEVLSEKFSVKYDVNHRKERELKCKFPLAQYKIIDVPLNEHKQADLHIKRDRSTPRDNLDNQLLECGFYEVLTPRNRIFTLQLESAEDAKIIFTALKNYFNLIGGIKQLNFEVVVNLVRFPNNFKMAKYLPKNQAILAL